MEKTTLIKVGTHILAGVAGIVVGSIYMYNKTTKRYYSDVEAIREHYRSKRIVDVPKMDKKEPEKPVISTGSEEIRQEFVMPKPSSPEFIDYRQFSKPNSDKEEVDFPSGPANTEVPYEISVSDLGEIEGYDEKTFTYFSNGVITDEEFNVVEQPEDILGEDYNKWLAEKGYQETVYIRNPITMVDYCIAPVDKPFYK